MNSKTIIIVLLITPALLAAPIAAQESPTGDSPTIVVERPNEQPDEQACETIDASTQICDSEMNGSRAIMVIESDGPQRVTFTDAGAILDGGEIFRQSRTLREGANRVTMPVTVVDGNAAVTVDTGSVLWGIVLRSDSGLLSDPITRNDVYSAALGAASAIALGVFVVTWRAITGRDDEPERVA